MRRVATAILIAVVGTVGLLSGVGARDSGPVGPNYTIELRNAYDLTEGGDFKIQGVVAGSIQKLSVDRRRHIALVEVVIEADRDLRLRSDATCTSRPQSLIGEYFVSCDPGRSSRELADGARIPIARTSSTIPQDLVNNILRVPQRQRLTLLLNEFGVGLAGRSGELNDAIRDGVPALRETDRLLATLSSERQRFASLTVNADRVVGELAARRRDVTRFVDDAGDAASVTAERRGDLGANLRRLPEFLVELRGTMEAVDEFALAQTPAAEELNRLAAPLEGFLRDFEPFARAARPGIRGLARASDHGRDATADSRATVAQLARLTPKLPELSKNLRFILEHLGDRSAGVLKDPRAARQLAAPGPGGDRYNGLEALLQYVYDQGQAVNLFNENGHYLQLDVIAAGICSQFADSKFVRENPDVEKQCSGNVISPASPGVHDPDPGKRPGSGRTGEKSSTKQREGKQPEGRLPADAEAAAAAPPASGAQSEEPVLDYLLGP